MSTQSIRSTRSTCRSTESSEAMVSVPTPKHVLRVFEGASARKVMQDYLKATGVEDKWKSVTCCNFTAVMIPASALPVNNDGDLALALTTYEKIGASDIRIHFLHTRIHQRRRYVARDCIHALMTSLRYTLIYAPGDRGKVAANFWLSLGFYVRTAPASRTPARASRTPWRASRPLAPGAPRALPTRRRPTATSSDAACATTETRSRTCTAPPTTRKSRRRMPRTCASTLPSCSRSSDRVSSTIALELLLYNSNGHTTGQAGRVRVAV